MRGEPRYLSVILFILLAGYLLSRISFCPAEMFLPRGGFRMKLLLPLVCVCVSCIEIHILSNRYVRFHESMDIETFEGLFVYNEFGFTKPARHIQFSIIASTTHWPPAAYPW